MVECGELGSRRRSVSLNGGGGVAVRTVSRGRCQGPGSWGMRQGGRRLWAERYMAKDLWTYCHRRCMFANRNSVGQCVRCLTLIV